MSTSTSTGRSVEDPRLAACWLVRVGAHVVGPVSLDQIERGVLEARIPPEADLAHVDHRRWSPVADLLPLSARPVQHDPRRRISGVEPTFVQRRQAPDLDDAPPSFPEDPIEIPKHGWLRAIFG